MQEAWLIRFRSEGSCISLLPFADLPRVLPTETFVLRGDLHPNHIHTSAFGHVCLLSRTFSAELAKVSCARWHMECSIGSHRFADLGFYDLAVFLPCFKRWTSVLIYEEVWEAPFGTIWLIARILVSGSYCSGYSCGPLPQAWP